MKTNWLAHLKNSRFHGVKELADAAEELLREIGPNQERGTVAEYPNERTIRYYISEGLLPEPMGKAGSASIFGYEHLVTLVAIKKLQAEGLPINVIKGMIDGRSIERLESLVDSEEATASESVPAPPTPAAESFQPLDEIQYSKLEAPQSTRPANAAKSFLESLLFGRNEQPKEKEIQLSELSDDDQFEFAVRSAPSQPPSEPDVPVWKRFEIESGLELHVRDDYEPTSGWRRALKEIEKILRRMSGK